MGIGNLIEEVAGAVAAEQVVTKVDPNAGILVEGAAVVAGFMGRRQAGRNVEQPPRSCASGRAGRSRRDRRRHSPGPDVAGWRRHEHLTREGSPFVRKYLDAASRRANELAGLPTLLNPEHPLMSARAKPRRSLPLRSAPVKSEFASSAKARLQFASTAPVRSPPSMFACASAQSRNSHVDRSSPARFASFFMRQRSNCALLRRRRLAPRAKSIFSNAEPRIWQSAKAMPMG